MGNMTVEEIYRDRKQVRRIFFNLAILCLLIVSHQFSNRVFEVASTDLVNMGIMIISYTIKDITDEVGYLAVSAQPTKIPLDWRNIASK